MVASAGSQEVAASRSLEHPGEAAVECGIAIEADAELMLASEPLFSRLSGQIGDALGRQLPVSVLLTGLQGDNAASRFESFCRRLADALDAPGAHTSLLEITIIGKDPEPGFAWRIRREFLGAGPLNILCDERSIIAEGFWRQLWCLRGEPLVSVACWPHVRSPCPLLTSECARNLLPCIGLQVPSESAWVTVSVSLQQLTDSRGDLDDNVFADRLVSLVAKSETIHRIACWPTAAMRHDAWMNRRLAIQFTGLGDYVLQRGLHPGERESLRSLKRILLRARSVLCLESQRVATSTELLPAIDFSNPARALSDGPLKNGWEQRWLGVVDRTGVRHRNLLVLSPWSLFPSGNADLRFRDLAPLLRLADACLFRERPPLKRWKINDFKHFHQGIWALSHQLESNTLVAERL